MGWVWAVRRRGSDTCVNGGGARAVRHTVNYSVMANAAALHDSRARLGVDFCSFPVQPATMILVVGKSGSKYQISPDLNSKQNGST